MRTVSSSQNSVELAGVSIIRTPIAFFADLVARNASIIEFISSERGLLAMPAIYAATAISILTCMNVLKVVPYYLLGQLNMANLTTSLVLMPLAVASVYIGLWLVRRIPADVMMGAMRRLDRHRGQILLDETLDGASESFQLALQLAYMEMAPQIRTELEGGSFATDEGRELTRRALASYAAAAILMPYAAFAKAAETKAYDMEALARQFRASFEQVAHRLTTLQKPGEERVPFFFIRIDPAGNVSKRLDGAGFPFASHGGACPLWSVHHVFKTPREIVTQWIELPDGQRFFSIARTVTAGGGTWGAARAERAIALGCDAAHAHKLIYTQGREAEQPTAIGVTCRLCHRPQCTARSAPPIGRELLPDDYRRSRAPFGFSDAG